MKNDISQSLWPDLVNINVCKKRFVNIFHSVQKIGPFSFFSEIGARQRLDR